jgi:hypothetical protein
MRVALRLLVGVCVWQVCVIGSFLALLASRNDHVWSNDDLVWFTRLAVCGLFVVGAAALASLRFGKIGSAIAGLLCGLLPSIIILTLVYVERPGFEATAAGAGIAYLLAVPSGVGGALAGIICARPEKLSVPSIISG